MAGDDTVDEHRGAKVYGKGCHRDPVRSTHSYTAYRWGHKWVVLAILVKFPFATRAWALPVLVALYRNPEKAPKAKAPATKPRRKKAKDKTKVKAKERARREAQAKAQAKTKAKAGRSTAATQDPFGADAATAGGADPLVPRSSIRLRRRWRVRHSRLGSVRRTASPSPVPGQPVLRQRRLCTTRAPPVVGKKPSHRPRKKGAKRPAPEAVVAATGSTAAAGGVLVRRRSPTSRGGQRDGPLAQVGRGPGRGACGCSSTT